jgi:hypothetical protein
VNSLDVEAEPFRHAISISVIGFIKVPDLQFLDAPWSLTQAANDIAGQSLSSSTGMSRNKSPASD